MTEKHTTVVVRGKRYWVGLSDMQGWRISMSFPFARLMAFEQCYYLIRGLLMRFRDRSLTVFRHGRFAHCPPAPPAS